MSGISSSVPSLAEIAKLASEGSVEAVLAKLSERQDYADSRKFQAAVASVAALVGKTSLGQAELIGHTKAGIIPVTPDWLGQALIERAIWRQSQSKT